MTGDIEVERQGRLQVIRMNRPEKKNAITRAMYAAMTEALRFGETDDGVGAQVFFGCPGAFSAGNDLADFLAAATGGGSLTEVWDFVVALATATKPLLSGVDGLAVGIGTTLNLHCDLTFATPRSVFRTPFVDLGLVPEAGSSLLAPLALGRQQAFALLALGEDLSGEQARLAGLIYAVVEPGLLESSVLEAAARIAAKPPEALRATRELMLGTGREALLTRIREEGERFQERLKSAEARAAFLAFLARKK